MSSTRLALYRGVMICASAAMLASCDRLGPAAQPQSAPTVIVLDDRLEPVIVIAAKPSISDILDLVLRAPTPENDEANVARVLFRYSADTARVERIASALVKEGRKRNIGSSLLVGVLLTENPWLDPKATSFVGARGLMQVMPFHAGNWNCGSRDLFDIESNICHGVAVLADNLGRSRTLPQALLGYNGCVRGTNTPDCRKYPRKVYAQARKSAVKGSFGG